MGTLIPFFRQRSASLEASFQTAASTAGQTVNTLRLGEATIAKTVCRHSVKANDLLTGPELENLIEDLRHCAMPYTCPHGRPTLIEMNFRCHRSN